MSQGIVRSIKFTQDLIDNFEKKFGYVVIEIANGVTPEAERKKLSILEENNLINNYVENMKFTIKFLEELKNKFGDVIVATVKELIIKEEQDRWQEVAKEHQDHSIENFISLAWKPLIPLGFEFTSTPTDKGVQINCTKCPIKTLSDVIGGKEWLTILECSKDLHNVAGFNSQIGFTRSKTLLNGDSHCNHFYYKK